MHWEKKKKKSSFCCIFPAQPLGDKIILVTIKQDVKQTTSKQCEQLSKERLIKAKFILTYMLAQSSSGQS